MPEYNKKVIDGLIDTLISETTKLVRMLLQDANANAINAQANYMAQAKMNLISFIEKIKAE